MKITDQLLVEASKCSPTTIQYIDLSYLNIARIQNLDSCVNLRVLILKGNQLDCLYGLERCKQLWKLDVSNNNIKSLDGLSKFVALGSLNLSNNDFNWSELEKIRHLHVIDLVIFDNKKLDKDPHYRSHLIDCLPYAWMLDGLIVTSAERAQVEYFFEQSALTSKPVRKKLPKEQFIPTELKTRDVYGDWTTKLLSKFPKNNIQNIEIDKRRLEFISDWFQDLMNTELRLQQQQQQLNTKQTTKQQQQQEQQIKLKHVLEYRLSNNEECNMILVLLVASLEFSIPVKFMEETLEYLNLNHLSNSQTSIGSIETMQLFLLPKACRIYVASLLLSLAKLDRDQNLDVNFYDHLFQSLHSILEEILRLSNMKSDERTTVNLTALRDHKSLLSTEITQLFCMIPSFYSHINTSEGLMIILEQSISDANIFDTIQNMLLDCHRKKKSLENISQEIGPFITNLLKINTRNLLNKKLRSKKPHSAFLNKTIHNSRLSGASTTGDSDVREKSINFYERVPSIGDNVLIGPQSVGRVIILPESDTALIQFDYLLGINGSMGNFGQPGDHYLYANLKHFEWDEMRKLWRPIGSTGDRVTFQYKDDIFEKKLVWPMNSNMNYMEEIKIEPLNVHAEQFSTKEAVVDEFMNIDKDSASIRSRNSENTNFRKNSGSKSAGRVTKLELDVNIKNGFTPRTSPLLTHNANTSRTSFINKKQKFNYDKEKENTQLVINETTNMDNSEFMRRWQSAKPSTAVGNTTPTTVTTPRMDITESSPRFLSAKNQQILLLPNGGGGGNYMNSNSAGNLGGGSGVTTPTKKLGLKKSSSYTMKARTKEKAAWESSPHETNGVATTLTVGQDHHNLSNRAPSTMDPDYQALDTHSSFIDVDVVDDGSKKPVIKYASMTQSQYSRPSSPTISTTTYSNLQRTPEQRASTATRKKNIKIQDCSSWLSGVQTLSGMQSRSNYFDQSNRMRIVMSLKSTRTSTRPKIPILTSPSSQAHEIYRGLRPGNEVYDLCLNSRKLQIK